MMLCCSLPASQLPGPHWMLGLALETPDSTWTQHQGCPPYFPSQSMPMSEASVCLHRRVEGFSFFLDSPSPRSGKDGQVTGQAHDGRGRLG